MSDLTEKWKAGELRQGVYYIKIVDLVFIDFFNAKTLKFTRFKEKYIDEVLAPVPTYDEYKAMQTELDEFKRTFTSYVGKPIDYDVACETVNKLLDDKKQLKKELESARWYQTVQNEDIGNLRRLLGECLAHLSLGELGTSVTPLNILLTRINAALNESEEHSNMLKNPENFNTSGGNVKGDNR